MRSLQSAAAPPGSIRASTAWPRGMTEARPPMRGRRPPPQVGSGRCPGPSQARRGPRAPPNAVRPAEEWRFRDAFELSTEELLALRAALNEVSNGPDAIEDWEFRLASALLARWQSTAPATIQLDLLPHAGSLVSEVGRFGAGLAG